jgi:hypothetical protein
MTVRKYGIQMQELVATITCYAPDTTVLGIAGKTVYSMVCAYTDDGILFLRQGDLVNALASFGYAEGWLDGGVFLGLVGASAPVFGIHMEDTLEPSMLPGLVEKVHRYHRLLGEGIMAVEPAPDQASILWKGAREIMVRAETALQEGRQQCSAGNLLHALRWFGYGHGWLDIGARTGLFRILGRRDLFTV